ncbi:MAG: DUF2793 domain-containing protein, partial [Maricaulaceae bacterium]
MSTDQTTNIGLPFVMPAQAQKHVTVNESLTRLDALVQLAVESRSVSAEPGSPGDGQIWILPAGKTGTAWGLYANWSLGYYRDGAWEQLSPKAGWRAYVKDEGRIVVYDGAAWGAAAPDASGFKNAVINGGFDVAQRGTSFTGETSGGYHLDRWRANAAGGTYDVTRQAFTLGQTDVPGEPAYYMDFEVTGASADVGPETRIEDVRTFAGGQATLSFYARSSSVPGDFKADLIQSFGSGGSAGVTVTSPTFTLTSSWQRFTWTADLGSLSGKTIGAGSYLGLRLRNADNETWQADIACVQLEAGRDATAFERRPLGVEEGLAK